MSTALDTETSTDTLVDFDPEYECESYRHEDGPVPRADWWSFALCCNRAPATLCTPCVEWETRGPRRCGTCHKHDTPEHPNRRYEPIRSQK